MRPIINEPTFTSSVEAHCDAEIQRLIDKGAISQVVPSEDQFLSPFFLIEKPSGGMRFILNLKDLKDLNLYISSPHFKLEDWRTVVRLMLPGSQMASLDLEDAYFLVSIHPEHSPRWALPLISRNRNLILHMSTNIWVLSLILLNSRLPFQSNAEIIYFLLCLV